MKRIEVNCLSGEIIEIEQQAYLVAGQLVVQDADEAAPEGGAIVDAALLAELTAPVPVVPQSVTMRQARLALLGAGLLGNVNAAVAAMPGAAGDEARIEWEFSSEVQRHKPLVQALAPALNLTDAQLDQLFIAAAQL